MIESFSPSLACAARRVGFDRVRLMHGEPGLAAEVLERRRRDYFVVVVFHRTRPDYPFGLDDLAINAVHPMVVAHAAHAETKLAARAEVHFADRQGEGV